MSFAGLPNVHLLMVHFPIALLPLSVALDALALVGRRGELERTARWALWLGTLGAAVAVYTGHEAADALRPRVSAEAGALMATHHDAAMAVLGAATVLSIWRFLAPRPPGRWRAVYLVVAIAVLVALAVVADLGGCMVFVHGVAVRGT